MIKTMPISKVSGKCILLSFQGTKILAFADSYPNNYSISGIESQFNGGIWRWKKIFAMLGMMAIKKQTKIIIASVAGGIVLLGLIFGLIDYSRVMAKEMPIFMIRVSDTSTANDEYLGLGYRFRRTVGVSYKEPLSLSVLGSGQVQFGLWFYLWDIDFGE